jgi:malate dehydrogenase (oxaloacetate-decarboxylating)(NADP+)
MKIACVREIADLAKAEVSDEVATAYQGRELRFGPDYLIPTPFDSRLILKIAPAVAKAAEESGVATRPIADIEQYRQSLNQFTTHTGLFMRPVFAAARHDAKRVVYAEGEDERVLRAVQIALDEKLVRPILVGRPAVIASRIERAGLRIDLEKDVELVNPEDDARFRQYWETYFKIKAREGVSPDAAKSMVRRSNTIIASLMVQLGDADGMICGLVGRYDHHLEHVQDIIGLREGVKTMAAVNALMLDRHTLFIADTFVNEEPTAEQLCEIASLTVDEVRRFGLPPKVAFLSHSMFGSSMRPSAIKMRKARDLFVAQHPDVECDGEMHGDAALDEGVRERFLPDSTLTGSANVLVMPNLDAAHILFNVLKITGGQGVTVGPILLGASAPVHVLTPSATVRRIVNMTAVAAANARQSK